MQTTKHREARLPWYTIYPTVSEFSGAVGAEVYEEWLRNLPADDPASLYLHVPFCRSKCWFCGFPTAITRHDAPILNYLAALRDEIRLVSEHAPQALPVSDVHFGGGTPALMGPVEFLALMEFLRRHFSLAKTATIAVEIDPRTFTAEMAEALEAAGVNRASLGVQSFDPIVQKAINRVQSEAQTAAAVEMLRRHGVRSINFDLIFGLPHQTVQSCVETTRAAVAMRPNRLAVFGYSHIPSFIKNQRLIDEASLPDSAARAEQDAAIAVTLIAAGYREIGLDHFALPDDDLALAQKTGRLRRNSLGYSADTCKTLIGFGASAIGRVGEGYVQNEVTRESYSRHIAAGRLATSKGYRLTDEDRARAAIIERLMCDLEADVPAICAAHGSDPIHLLESTERLAMLAKDGIVVIEKGFVRVWRQHRFAIRGVAAAFDAFLDRVAP
ncbi:MULTISPECIES: oxygen-independent coproporphyrinogen III oxidase [Mesorhizobium]|uniref:oxygen-independent coproporphyrinogen III oxidase n=1 Tax=Mesorhizobium TaxID=68287 RepID=UPI0007FD84A0|nr:MULTISPECIES: oxygen-independent coproporphyrinogen III oxidase [Mesorhizobium]MUT31347.1 oxygen-independent coproporphyrinogen III oxidase [Mesorhizobium japonicum]OBQ78123.1 oxygen-independent coproporphyrinogen III oxidase [Mesorhizobium sp. WSM3873]